MYILLSYRQTKAQRRNDRKISISFLHRMFVFFVSRAPRTRPSQDYFDSYSLGPNTVIIIVAMSSNSVAGSVSFNVLPEEKINKIFT